MILMKKIVLLALAFGSLTGALIAGNESKEYSQTYVIFLDNARAGKEIVKEAIDDNGDLVAVSENDIYVTDGLETKRMAYTTRMVMHKKSLKPKSYFYQYLTGNTGDSYEVIIEGDKITRTLSRGGETSVVTGSFGPDTIILDFTVYHQYDYLAKKYDDKKKGRQVFSNFIPVIGNDIPVAFTYLEDAELPYIGGNLPVKRYKIEFVGLRQGTVLMDSEGRLVHLLMPDQDLEVVREDLVPANR